MSEFKPYPAITYPGQASGANVVHLAQLQKVGLLLAIEGFQSNAQSTCYHNGT